jgi:hypothetical protein
MNMEELRNIVLQNAKDGNVVFLAMDEIMAAPLDEFVKQPTEGLLYDLNRDKVTVLAFIDDPKWVNDFAVALVIEKLKDNDAALRAENDRLREALTFIDPMGYKTDGYYHCAICDAASEHGIAEAAPHKNDCLWWQAKQAVSDGR